MNQNKQKLMFFSNHIGCHIASSELNFFFILINDLPRIKLLKVMLSFSQPVVIDVHDADLQITLMTY